MTSERSQRIKEEIIKVMDKAPAFDKYQIFTVVSQNLHVARPTVRRVARDLRIEMMRKIEVLQSQ